MPRRPASEQGDTLREIREAAFHLFGRYGYDGVSVGDIAHAAKLSKGALYWHFDGKSALFLVCLRRMHQIFDDSIFSPMREQPDAVNRVLGMFQGLSHLLQDPRITAGVSGYWLSINNARMPAIQATQAEFEARTAGIIREALALGISQGKFDLEDDLDDMSQAIIAIVEAIVLPLRNQSSDQVHRVLAVLARTLFRAYATSDEVLALARKF